MFNWKVKAVNAIYLDENVGGKGKYFKSRFLQPGLVKYSFGVCVLDKGTIDKFIQDFVGCPVIINHKDVTEESAKDDRVGAISRVWYDEQDGWYWGEGVIFDDEALNLIDSGYNVSCQYEITEYAENKTKALHNGNEYDKVILNGKPEHLAIVKNPRYENAMIAVNAMEVEAVNEDKKEFVTVGEGDSEHVIPTDYVKDDKRSFESYARDILKRAIVSGASDFEKSEDGYAVRFTIPERTFEERERKLIKILQADSKVEDYSFNGSRDGRRSISIRFKNKVKAENYLMEVVKELKDLGMFKSLFRKREDVMKDNLLWAINELQEEGYFKSLLASNENDKKGRWITVKGNHVFVPEGKEVGEVLKERFDTEEDRVSEDLKGKYMREDVEFDIEQAKKDIEKAKELGYETVDDIAEFLGLDPDEVLGMGEEYEE